MCVIVIDAYHLLLQVLNLLLERILMWILILNMSNHYQMAYQRHVMEHISHMQSDIEE